MKTQPLIQSTLLALTLAAASQAQHEHHHTPPDPALPESAATAPNRAPLYLLGLSSGTSVNPSSSAMPMAMNRKGGWNFMSMGQAFVVNTQQSGPRGGDGTYSANWGMLAAVHNIGRGSFMLRGMVSLEPLTVTGKRYPLLFQTGETAGGKPIADGQHPHDFVMELGVHYARPVGQRGLWSVYYAPVGDVAFGPVAFPHRASAMELPQATLGHHWQDSTHIATNVITTGFQYRTLRLEGSGFRGLEPNENRWNIDMGPIDSWAARLTWQPNSNWVAQASAGRLRQPETTHSDDIIRATGSVHYTRAMGHARQWSSSLIWARNYKTQSRYATQSVLGETLVPVTRKNLLTARFEWSQRDELFEYDHDLAHDLYQQTGKRAFGVSAATLGYTRELGSLRGLLRVAAGANVTLYAIAKPLTTYYGSSPRAANMFLRFRL